MDRPKSDSKKALLALQNSAAVVDSVDSVVDSVAVDSVAVDSAVDSVDSVAVVDSVVVVDSVAVVEVDDDSAVAVVEVDEVDDEDDSARTLPVPFRARCRLQHQFPIVSEMSQSEIECHCC